MRQDVVVVLVVVLVIVVLVVMVVVIVDIAFAVFDILTFPFKKRLLKIGEKPRGREAFR